MSDDTKRALEIAQAEYEYWAHANDEAGDEVTIGGMCAAGAAANIVAAIAMGWSVEEVKRRIAERDQVVTTEAAT